MKTRKERCDGAATREALMAAAEVEFATKGFALGSTREICRAAQANSALLSRYFGTKEDMYRLVAKRLFGDLGKPMSQVAETVVDAATWRAAVEKWVDDFLYMSIPTARPQRLCAGLFRHEVTAPTMFHAEFKERFGRPVYEALWKLVAMAEPDEGQVELWTASIWSQVAVYALADAQWHASFRPRGVALPEWRGQVKDFICKNVFAHLKYRG